MGGGALSGLIIGAGNSLIQGNSANQIMIDAAGGAMMGALMAPVGALIGGKIGNLMMKTRFGKAIGAWYSHHSKGLFFDKNNSLSPFFKAVRPKDAKFISAGPSFSPDDLPTPSNSTIPKPSIGRNTDNAHVEVRNLQNSEWSEVGLTNLEPTHGVNYSKNEFQKFINDMRKTGITNESVKYIEYSGTKYIVDGHHRYYAYLKIGKQTIPTTRVDFPYGNYKTPYDLIFDGKKLPSYWKYLK